jgi:geranylgeranyl pyrophosphate synthase
LRFWERADAAEKARFQEMVANWNPHSVAPALELLAKYDALAESTAVIHQYLGQAIQLLEKLPPAASQDGLAGLTKYLARQTDALGGCA